MSIINESLCTLYYDYKHPLKGDDFNGIMSGLIKPGIYSGGELSYVGNVVTIQPFVAYIKYSATKGIRIESTVAVSRTVTSANPMLYVSFDYLTVIENWPDFGICNSGTLGTYDLSFGEATFSGPNVDGISYANKSTGLINANGDITIDTITEATEGSGVTIESITIEDSTITSSASAIDILKTINVDTINEYTGSAGVTIEGITLIDGYINEPLGIKIAPVSGSNLHVHQADSGANLLKFTNTTTGATASDGFDVGINASEQGRLWNYENTDLIIGTNNTDYLHILNSGFIGINNSTPTRQLDIITATTGSGFHIGTILNGGGFLTSASADAITISGGSEFTGTNWIARATTQAMILLSSGTMLFRTDTGLTAGNTFTPTTRMTLSSTGLGIGVTPSNPLHVQSTTTPQMRIAYDATDYLTIGVASSGVATLTSSTGTIAFGSNISSAVVITDTTNSSSSTTGAVIIGSGGNGGLGVAEDGYFGGLLNAGTTITAGTGITATTGNIVATAGNLQAGANLVVTGNYTQPLKVTDATGSSSSATGCAILSGGLGVAENIYGGHQIHAADHIYTATNMYVGANLLVTGNYSYVLKVADSTESTTKDTGCAILEGGLGVEKNVSIGGNLQDATGNPVAGWLSDGTPYYIKQMDIGDWDMDTDASVTVAHGLTWTDIISVEVSIRNDTPNHYYSLLIYDAGEIGWDSTNIELKRSGSGFFDNVNYNNTSYNRGIILIKYV